MTTRSELGRREMPPTFAWTSEAPPNTHKASLGWRWPCFGWAVTAGGQWRCGRGLLHRLLEPRTPAAPVSWADCPGALCPRLGGGAWSRSRPCGRPSSACPRVSPLRSSPLQMRKARKGPQPGAAALACSTPFSARQKRARKGAEEEAAPLPQVGAGRLPPAILQGKTVKAPTLPAKTCFRTYALWPIPGYHPGEGPVPV